MAKHAISVTLGSENLTWLRARTGATGVRSVSALLDRLISDARATGGAPGTARSVVGTIDIDASDPLLLGADEAIGELYEVSLRRPLLMKEKSAQYRGSPGRRRRG